MILDVFTTADLIESEGDFEVYILSIKNDYFSVISLSYEYGDEPEVSYQTEWFKTKEQAIQAYKNDLQ